MEARTYAIVGGVVLVIGLLHFFMGSTKRAETYYADAETLYQHRDYQGAIVKYEKAIKASKKLGAKTKHIHKDFPGFVNYKIALCYDKLGETKNDNRFYAKALSLIDKTKDETNEYQLREKLYFLWAQILHKTKEYVQAELKYSYFLSEFPNSNMVPDALYYDGVINKELLRYKDSQESFQRIIDEFPTSRLRNEAEYYKAQVIIQENKLGDSPVNKSEDQKLYDTAVKMMQEDKVYDAYQLLSTIIKQYPNSQLISNTHESIGDIYYNVENYVKARQYYEFAMNSTTDIQRKHLLNEKYHKTIVPDPPEPKVNHEQHNEYFIKATIYRKEKKYRKAAELYETLSNINLSSDVDISTDDVIYALYWSGYCYYQAAKAENDENLFSKSIASFDRLIDQYKDNANRIETYFYLASAYWDWGNALRDDKSKYRLVIETADEVKRETVNDTDAKYSIWLSQLRDLRQKAVKKINPVTPPSPIPDNPEEKLVEQGRNHYFNGELIKATNKAREALNIDSNYQPARQLLSAVRDKYYEQGWTLLDENLYDYAITEFERSIDIDPNFDKAYCNLGVIYILKENYSSAVNALKQAIDINKSFKEAHFNIGLAYLRLGKYENAKSAANTALAIDPNYQAARALRNVIED